jgi:predicted hydrolase (HD superfamily)
MTRVEDPVLRAQLVIDILVRAEAWEEQAHHTKTLSDQHACHMRAAVLKQLARDLEEAEIGL